MEINKLKKRINRKNINKIKKKLILFLNNIKNLFILNKIINSAIYHNYMYYILNKNFIGLHLGASNKIKDFYTIDANIFTKADIIARFEKLKIREEAVNILYCSHCFEHIPRAKAMRVLIEWHRVLKVGGILYISVPNLETLFKLYLNNINKYDTEEGKNLVDHICGIIYGGQINKYDFHNLGYSYFTLKSMLEDVGFRVIKHYQPKELDFINFEDASFASMDGELISLNIKAIK
jgi:predicted SAM-dependent methyltransferase